MSKRTQFGPSSNSNWIPRITSGYQTGFKRYASIGQFQEGHQPSSPHRWVWDTTHGMFEPSSPNFMMWTRDFFQTSRQPSKYSGLAKWVMTGVICLRNISVFCDSNSSTNLPLIERSGDIRLQWRRLRSIQMCKDSFWPIDQVSKLPKKTHNFISKMLFKVHNGFHFTPKSHGNISLISPRSKEELVKHQWLNLSMKEKNEELDFKPPARTPLQQRQISSIKFAFIQHGVFHNKKGFRWPKSRTWLD